MVYDFGGGTSDVTINLAYWAEEYSCWKYIEIAAGGNYKLGGEDVTTELSKLLFNETEDERVLYWSEWIKINLNENEKKFNRKEIKRRLNLEDESQITVKIQKAHKDIMEWLSIKVNDILDEILIKTKDRLENHIEIKLNKPISLIILLAGNASYLDGFPRIIKDLTKNWIKSQDTNDLIKLDEVRIIDPPKACVAKGAYLSLGQAPNIDRIFEPHFSFWLQLPMDSDVDSSYANIYKNEHGQKFLEIISEGEKRPFQNSFDRKKIGIHSSGDYIIFKKQGVIFEQLVKEYLTNPEDKKNLLVTINTEERITLSWQ